MGYNPKTPRSQSRKKMSLALLPPKIRVALLVGLAAFLLLTALLTIIPIRDDWFVAVDFVLLLITGGAVDIYVRTKGIGPEPNDAKGSDSRLKA